MLGDQVDALDCLPGNHCSAVISTGFFLNLASATVPRSVHPVAGLVGELDLPAFFFFQGDDGGKDLFFQRCRKRLFSSRMAIFCVIDPRSTAKSFTQAISPFQ